MPPSTPAPTKEEVTDAIVAATTAAFASCTAPGRLSLLVVEIGVFPNGTVTKPAIPVATLAREAQLDCVKSAIAAMKLTPYTMPPGADVEGNCESGTTGGMFAPPCYSKHLGFLRFKAMISIDAKGTATALASTPTVELSVDVYGDQVVSIIRDGYLERPIDLRQYWWHRTGPKGEAFCLRNDADAAVKTKGAKRVGWCFPFECVSTDTGTTGISRPDGKDPCEERPTTKPSVVPLTVQ
ncbi:MAG: hypothetical protein ACHREM_16155 [Polyangiales bacterium]